MNGVYADQRVTGGVLRGKCFLRLVPEICIQGRPIAKCLLAKNKVAGEAGYILRQGGRSRSNLHQHKIHVEISFTTHRVADLVRFEETVRRIPEFADCLRVSGRINYIGSEIAVILPFCIQSSHLPLRLPLCRHWGCFRLRAEQTLGFQIEPLNEGRPRPCGSTIARLEQPVIAKSDCGTADAHQATRP
jgi:hypothetical protein